MRPTLAALLLALVAGCGGSPDEAPDASTSALYSCAKETRAIPYMAGLSRTSASGHFKAIWQDADPAPPSRGTNTWTVEIDDENGAPQDGLTITASPFMPDHNHPSTVKAVVTPMGNGVYSMTPLYLYMPGYWEVTLSFTPAGSGEAGNTDDSVVFPVCIPG
ncbi:MAG TPA: FixH family protein [Polyangia bacterium]|nr:FixH family protein [Polyangia bacterium]